MDCLADEVVQQLVDGELAQSELDGVDAHLDACASCRALVTALVVPVDRERLARGSELGHFVILGEIGTGAMGTVYAAYDPELDRKVALKLVRGEDRALIEARAMAKLSHPNVVQVYEVGAHGGRVFVAMELIEGATLREWLSEPRRPDAIVALFAAAGRGLSAAHDAGLVHRDFKPDNVLVGRDGEPRVTDFGLAAAASESGAGALIGTPAYMAPEQLDGAKADARSDQFAFAAALYEALYGARPFGGEGLRALRESIARGPSARSRAGVPRRVAAAIARALREDPSARFADMRTLLRELAPRPAGSWWIAGLAALAIGAAGLAALALREPDPCANAGAAMESVWSSTRRDAMREAISRASYGGPTVDRALGAFDRWAEAWTGARVGVCRAPPSRRTDAQSACLARALEQTDALAQAVIETGAEHAAEAVADLPDLDACREPDALEQRALPPRGASAAIEAAQREVAQASAALTTARLDEAQRHSARAVEQADAIRWAPLRAEALFARARTALEQGDPAHAEPDATQALLAAEEGGDDRMAARAQTLLVSIDGARGELDRALEQAAHARARIVRVGSPAELRVALSTSRAVVLTELDRFDEAESELDDALAIAPGAFGAQSTRVAALHTDLGNVARSRGELDRALEHHRLALEIDERALGPAHPRIGRHHHNIAGIYRLMGDYARAREHYEQALAIKRAALGDDHPEVGLTENSLGLLLAEMGQRGEARVHYERALAILRGQAEEAVVDTNLGLLEADDGHLDRALELQRAAVALLRTQHSPERLAHALGALAETEARLQGSAPAPHVRPAAPEEHAAPVPPPPRSEPTYLPGRSWGEN